MYTTMQRARCSYVTGHVPKLQGQMQIQRLGKKFWGCRKAEGRRRRMLVFVRCNNFCSVKKWLHSVKSIFCWVYSWVQHQFLHFPSIVLNWPKLRNFEDEMCFGETLRMKLINSPNFEDEKYIFPSCENMKFLLLSTIEMQLCTINLLYFTLI